MGPTSKIDSTLSKCQENQLSVFRIDLFISKGGNKKVTDGDIRLACVCRPIHHESSTSQIIWTVNFFRPTSSFHRAGKFSFDILRLLIGWEKFFVKPSTFQYLIREFFCVEGKLWDWKRKVTAVNLLNLIKFKVADWTTQLLSQLPKLFVWIIDTIPHLWIWNSRPSSATTPWRS